MRTSKMHPSGNTTSKKQLQVPRTPSRFLSDSQCHVLERFCTHSVSGVPWRIHGILFAWEQSLLSVQLTIVWVHGIAFCTVWQIFHSKFLSSLGAWTLNSCYQQIGLSSRIPSPSLIPRHGIFFQCSFHTWHSLMTKGICFFLMLRQFLNNNCYWQLGHPHFL
jgi:hypothetical protein